MRSLKERKWFYSQEKEPIASGNPEAPYKLYKLKSTGQTVCEYVLDIGVGGNYEFAVMGDLHFNLCIREDDDDPEIPYTSQCRTWGKDGDHIDRARRSLDAASYSDDIVIVGDIIDYLSKGAIYATKKFIIEPYPDAMLTIGWHDMTKQMQTKRPNLLTNEERMNILAEFWPNDIHYYSRNIGDNLKAVCMGNIAENYTSDPTKKLAADIEAARAENRYILVFQHEPVSTWDKKYSSVKNVIAKTDWNNYYDNNFGHPLIGGPDYKDAVGQRVYDLIAHNADVVKGVFAGHLHAQDYTEIAGSYEKDGKTVAAVIPQHTVACGAYFPDGYLMRVIVK